MAIDTLPLTVGIQLDPLSLPRISRTTLALYAGASGDPNSVHIDVDAARRAGFDDVFAHGMLVMAYLGRLVTQWAPQRKLRTFSGRFAAITHLGDELTCHGTVQELIGAGSERCARLALKVVDQRGEIKITGEAIFDVG